MNDAALFLLTIGGLLLLSIATDTLGRRTFLPRVSLLVAIGVLFGGDVLDLIPPVLTDQFEIVANIALTMVGFLLGGKLTRESLGQSGRKSIWISLSAALGTTVTVAVGLMVFGAPVDIAILLGCIASATAPAATVDIVMESRTSKRPFSRLLLMVVALDDAWGLILFSIGLAIVTTMNGIDGAVSPALAASKEIGGATVLGLLIGLPAAYLTGRIKPGQPALAEALGLVFVCGGLAIWLNVSFLIASMVMGATIANLARHHDYPFHAIEDIEWPFMVIFFVLAGASLETGALRDVGLIGFTYIIFRVAGKLLGAWLGARVSGADSVTRRWMGLSLLPQAGVAIGMALLAANTFPAYASLILTVVISATILFELVGPAFTRFAISRAIIEEDASSQVTPRE
jgi:Kef-type K+ transport system membrane component KefB